MALKNTPQGYGLVSISLHWLMAVGILGLALLGLWMTDLTYYSPWYRTAPFWHKSVGILLAVLLLVRLLWRWSNPRPAHLSSHTGWETRLASLVHGLLYLLLLVILLSGYLISTARGQGISVFGWFELPALISGLPQQADRAGAVHYWAAMLLLGLVGLHALGALKHHLIDRDNTLRRMLGLRPRTPTKEN
ncbi:cytochrome b [Halopseudomonas yangmingensis]|uniref:Cytochrome b561 n=1 Tax=Halopseudomonas yangmingensis TaxID=1720063 RepID=A0A1I4PCD6_9GAMM|nr:cytochrome b [Halopseudomonas yangmingensis]SFM25033.1 cytochrome b561 [Halopseudomonas yangmingensis]